jgi:hypothetical protein
MSIFNESNNDQVIIPDGKQEVTEAIPKRPLTTTYWLVATSSTGTGTGLTADTSTVDYLQINTSTGALTQATTNSSVNNGTMLASSGSTKAVLSKWIYLACSDSSITQFVVDAINNKSQWNGNSATIASTCSFIIVDPTSKFMYVGTGAGNSVYGFAINATTGKFDVE